MGTSFPKGRTSMPGPDITRTRNFSALLPRPMTFVLFASVRGGSRVRTDTAREGVAVCVLRHRNGMVLLAALLALVAGGRAAEAMSTVNQCNAGNTAISLVTIGDEPGGGWVIDGWQAVAVGECHAVDLTFHIKIGVAIVKAGSRRGMQ